VKGTNGAAAHDLVALFKRGNDLRREADELHRTAEELATKAARLREDVAKQNRPTPRGLR
jgi:uncharacterized coiled-coil DUF342 family protein